YENALAYQNQHTIDIDDREEFEAFFTPANPDRPEIHGGFARSHWCGKQECELAIKDRLNVTIRCIPFDREKEQGGTCIECGAPAQKGRVVFAKAY
ncbi:MAG: proline--tRNA ligase, partial [Desulfobacterales bacterium]